MANNISATEAGVVAMQNIARRYQQVFPDILTANYSRARFLFRHAESERSNTSIRAFASGLFGDAASQNVVYEDVPEADWFLRPFDFCPLHDEGEIWDAQRVAFQQGPEFEEMLEQINRKLGFHGTNPLSFETIYVMWDWCRYETSSTFEFAESETGGDSAWCAPFSVAHHLLFEYFDDLGHIYASGYGVRNQRLLENMHCGVMQDLLNFIDADNNDELVARIFVSHMREVQSMLVVLGAFRDTWLLHQHNYAQQSGRHWLPSLITPNAANLAVIHYE